MNIAYKPGNWDLSNPGLSSLPMPLPVKWQVWAETQLTQPSLDEDSTFFNETKSLGFVSSLHLGTQSIKLPTDLV